MSDALRKGSGVRHADPDRIAAGATLDDEPPVDRRNLLHHVLVGLHVLARVPAPLVALALLALGALLSGAWYSASLPERALRALPGALASGGLYLAAAFADWAWLAALPRWGISYGPVEPSLAGLAVVRLLLALLALAGCSLWGAGSTTCLAVSALLQGAISLLVLYATAVEPFRLGVTHVELRSDKLPPGARLRLVQLSDLHVERLTRRERALIERVNALEADYILLTGDYLSFSFVGEARAIADTRRVLGSLRARAVGHPAIYAVRGTHSVDPNRLMPVLFEGLGIPWLRNRHVVIERPGAEGVEGYKLCFAGASCTGRRDIDVPAVERALDGIPPEAFTVLLFHMPDRLQEARAGGVDLYLAGHTHGGQIRLPLYGAMLTATETGKRYEMGRYDLDGLTLYVSRGVGMEGMAAPRARFLCPPQIVCLDVVGS